MPLRPFRPVEKAHLLRGAAVLLTVTAMGPLAALATQPAPERVALAVPASRDLPASAKYALPDIGQPELSHALGGLRRATAVPVPLAAEMARRVLLNACLRDQALRSHWLCHNGP